MLEELLAPEDTFAATLLAAANELYSFYGVIHSHGPVLPPAAQLQLHTQAKNACSLLQEVWGGPLPPKFHAWVHCACRAGRFGNPAFFSLHVDESLNGVLARLCSRVLPARWSAGAMLRYALMRAARGRPY